MEEISHISTPSFERCVRTLYIVQIEQLPESSNSLIYVHPVYAETDEEAKALAEKLVAKRGPGYRLFGITKQPYGFVVVHERLPGVVDDYRGPLPGRHDGKTLWILQYADGERGFVHAIYARDEHDADRQALSYELSRVEPEGTQPRFKLSCYQHGYNIPSPEYANH